jgi:hypothetical protein
MTAIASAASRHLKCLAGLRRWRPSPSCRLRWWPQARDHWRLRGRVVPTTLAKADTPDPRSGDEPFIDLEVNATPASQPGRQIRDRKPIRLTTVDVVPQVGRRNLIRKVVLADEARDRISHRARQPCRRRLRRTFWSWGGRRPTRFPGRRFRRRLGFDLARRLRLLAVGQLHAIDAGHPRFGHSVITDEVLGHLHTTTVANATHDGELPRQSFSRRGSERCGRAACSFCGSSTPTPPKRSQRSSGAAALTPPPVLRDRGTWRLRCRAGRPASTVRCRGSAVRGRGTTGLLSV